MHETRPAAKRSAIHRQYVVRLCDPLEPCLDLCGLGRIQIPRDLNTGLEFADGHG